MKPENIGCKGFAGDYAANIRLGGHGPFLLTIDTSSSRTAITGNSLGRNVSKWLNFSKAEGAVNTQLKAGGAYTHGSFLVRHLLDYFCVHLGLHIFAS